MTQINLLSIFGFIKKYSGWIVAGIILLVMFNCNPQFSHAELIKERNAENKELEKKIDGLLIANKAKDKQIAEAEKKVLEKGYKEQYLYIGYGAVILLVGLYIVTRSRK